MIDSRDESLFGCNNLLLRGRLNIWHFEYHTRKDIEYLDYECIWVYGAAMRQNAGSLQRAMLTPYF